MKRILLATAFVALSVLAVGCNSDSKDKAVDTKKEEEIVAPTMFDMGAFHVPTEEEQAEAELQEYFNEMDRLYGDQISSGGASQSSGVVHGDYKFTEYTELSDKFMEFCENGDVDGMFSLYYDNGLMKTYERMKDKLTLDQFKSLIKEEMATVYSFEEMEYGSEDMPEISSPLSYVNQFLYRAGLEPLQLTENQVTDCANLRVYKNGGYPSDYILACIDGFWYLVS